MEHKKTKIVLDADVIIHFMEANYFSILPDIFPEYEYLILDVVYNEISQNSGTKDFIDKYLHFFPKLKKEVFSPKRESMKCVRGRRSADRAANQTVSKYPFHSLTSVEKEHPLCGHRRGDVR